MRRFREEVVDVGRAEGLALRLDPESDLHVSGRHARFQRRDGVWWVRDLDSRNGTFVDGAVIRDWTPARPGTRVRFGWEGPEVEVLDPDASAPAAAGSSRMRWASAIAVLLVVATVSAVVASGRARESERGRWEAERERLVARVDSALSAGDAAIGTLEGEVDGLADALGESRGRFQGLQRQLDELAAVGETDARELEVLRAQIDEAAATIASQRRAAALDAPSLVSQVRPAVVMVYTEFSDGRRTVASGFAIEGQGRIVTNRHVVAGPDGRDPFARIGVQFSGSSQVWPAELERMSPRDDLALLRLQNLRGENPSVPGLNLRADTLGVGAPLLLVGFPGASPAAEGGPVPRAATTAGVLLAIEPDRIEIDGWGSEGASGSPVVASDGTVVGVLFGAVEAAGQNRLVAVPTPRLVAFLGDR